MKHRLGSGISVPRWISSVFAREAAETWHAVEEAGYVREES